MKFEPRNWNLYCEDILHKRLVHEINSLLTLVGTDKVVYKGTILNTVPLSPALKWSIR